MQKLNVSSPTFTLSPTSRSDLSTGLGQGVEPAPRLIVLFPASKSDTPELERRIWEIARSLHLNVLLLSVTNDFDEEVSTSSQTDYHGGHYQRPQSIYRNPDRTRSRLGGTG